MLQRVVDRMCPSAIVGDAIDDNDNDDDVGEK